MANHSTQQQKKVTASHGTHRRTGKRPFWEHPAFRLAVVLLIFGLAAYFGLPEEETLPASPSSSSQAPLTEEPAEETVADVAGKASVHFIDVGQGDSILLEQNGEYALIDTGTPGSRDALQAYLDGQGVTRLSYLILTHYHADHIGGALRVLDNYTVDTVLLPNAELGPTVTSSTAMKLMEAVAERTEAGTLKSRVPNVGDEFPLGDGTITVVGAGIDAEDLNSTSLITLFRLGKFTFFSSGDADTDAETELLQRMPDGLQSSLYKSTHHGSRTGNSTALLEAVQPNVIVISCGADNDYGHPHTEAMERMQATGATIYRTDLRGSIVVTAENGRMTVTCEKKEG